MAEFIVPEFLRNKGVANIHSSMMRALPVDIDKSEGNHVWNLTRPTALEVARVCEFILPEVVKLIFPEWSYGTYLDEHAMVRGMRRRSAVAATGAVVITGTPNSEIPEGSMFSTASVNGEPSVDYISLESARIGIDGSVEVPVRCTKTGIVGNTPPETVIFNSSRVQGISGVKNTEDITGGAEIESDESLIERIVEYDRTQGESFVGNPQDYRRWTLSVDGVGSVVVIPAEDDSGLVTLIITDMDHLPATPELCDDVYNYIMRPDEPALRRAPVNAVLNVRAPDALYLSVEATIELKPGYTLDMVTEDFLGRLALYMPVAMEEAEVKYTKVASELSETEGVNDYSGLRIGSRGGALGVSNISISTTQLPMLSPDDLTFVEGVV